MKRRLLFALLLAIPLSSAAQTRWHEDPALGFKVSVPTSWAAHAYVEGTDEIRAWTSPDENVALLIRTATIPEQVTLDMVLGVYEQNVLPGAERLILQDHTLNGVTGKMAGYRWTFNDIPVIVGAFFAVRPGTFYALSSIIPQEMFQARTAETDAIMNTFTLMEKAAAPQSMGGQVGAASPPSNMGGAVTKDPPSNMGGNVGNAPSNQGGSTGSSPSNLGGQPKAPPAGYVTMVEETAQLEFAIPQGFKVTSAEPGMQQWQGPAGTEDADVKMVIQTVTKDRGDYSNLEEAFITLIRQVQANSAATEVEKRRVTSAGGMEVVLYTFDLEQAVNTLRFVYAITETPGYITHVSFLGPVQRAYRQEAHAEQVAATFTRSGGASSPQPSSNPSTPVPSPGNATLRGPAGLHIANNLPGSLADARQAASGYRFWGQNMRMRMELPQNWTEVRNTGITGYTRYVHPDKNINAAFTLQEFPADRKSFETIIKEGEPSHVGTVTINGTEYHAYQSIRHMGPPTNMQLRSDWLVWQYGPRKTYLLNFTGDARTWNQAVAPMAQHLLMSLTMTGS